MRFPLFWIEVPATMTAEEDNEKSAMLSNRAFPTRHVEARHRKSPLARRLRLKTPIISIGHGFRYTGLP